MAMTMILIHSFDIFLLSIMDFTSVLIAFPLSLSLSCYMSNPDRPPHHNHALFGSLFSGLFIQLLNKTCCLSSKYIRVFVLKEN